MPKAIQSPVRPQCSFNVRALPDSETRSHVVAHLVAAIFEVSIQSLKELFRPDFFYLRDFASNGMCSSFLCQQKLNSRRNDNDQQRFHVGEEEVVQILPTRSLRCFLWY